VSRLWRIFCVLRCASASVAFAAPNAVASRWC